MLIQYELVTLNLFQLFQTTAPVKHKVTSVHQTEATSLLWILGFNQVSVPIAISGFELSMMLLRRSRFRLMDWKFILGTVG